MVHSPEDLAFLHSIPTGVIHEFRAEIFHDSYVKKNPSKFIDTAWVNIDDLKAFMKARTGPRLVEEDASRVQSVVKLEREASPAIQVKQEHEPIHLVGVQDSGVRYRTLFEDGKEVIDLLSSDDESDSMPMPVDSEDPHSQVFNLPVDDDGMSSDTVVGRDEFDSDSESDTDLHDRGLMSSGSDPFSESGDDIDLELDGLSHGMPTSTLELKPSLWLDSDISSTIQQGPFRVTRQCSVDALEYISGLPTYWPIPRDSRAYIVDLSDPKYDIKDKDGNLLSIDALIKNSDQDSWTGCSGNGQRDSRPLTSIFGIGQDQIRCRRSRLSCAGYAACEHVNPDLINIARYELDPSSLDDIVKAQIETRKKEADSPEKLALTFFAICHSSPCAAKADDGQLCTGVPTLRKYRDNAIKNGHHHFIACTGWSRSFPNGHRSASIPSGVRDEDLAKLFAGESIQGLDPFPCGRVVSAHIGQKSQYCKYPHQANGSKAKMIRHSCPASRTIFVPEDPKIRKACIVPNYEKPHTHPILPAVKASAMIRTVYKECVEAAGIVGRSVRSVDNAQTTRMILGNTPSLFSPALQNNRLKQDIVRKVKSTRYPCGNDIPGVIHIMKNDLAKPLEERYVHSYSTTKEGGSIIITANSFLLGRIHHATTVFVDTTFKRAIGTMKEWELVIWDPHVQRALTLCRGYTDRSDRAQYKAIFDELRQVTFRLTGRHLKFKKLSRDGTLLSLLVDLELAQALGAGDSFLETNEPEYSNIHNPKAEEIIQHFLRGCYTHAKRGVQDFKPLVNEEDYNRIANFMYMTSQEEVDEFSAWIKTLKITKIDAWWDHKLNNKWILPSLIKALSKMNPEDWDRTPSSTNIGESQHHWTNINTGIKLSLVEAIETARECDTRVANEVRCSLEKGILKNHRNDTFTRMSRNTARANNTAKKMKESHEKNDAISEVQSQIDAIAAKRKEDAEQLKTLKEKKAELTSAKSGKGSKAESSSSGRVRSNMAVGKERAVSASKAATIKSGEAPLGG